jgi:hypothetical protein
MTDCDCPTIGGVRVHWDDCYADPLRRVLFAPSDAPVRVNDGKNFRHRHCGGLMIVTGDDAKCQACGSESQFRIVGWVDKVGAVTGSIGGKSRVKP